MILDPCPGRIFGAATPLSVTLHSTNEAAGMSSTRIVPPVS